MAVEEQPLRKTLPSAADLSTHQYKWVSINSAGRAAVAAEGTNAFGILQNKPAAIDREAAVWHGGTAKAVCGGTVTAGNKVTCDLNGRTVTVGSGDDYQ